MSLDMQPLKQSFAFEFLRIETYNLMSRDLTTKLFQEHFKHFKTFYYRLKNI